MNWRVALKSYAGAICDAKSRKEVVVGSEFISLQQLNQTKAKLVGQLKAMANGNEIMQTEAVSKSKISPSAHSNNRDLLVGGKQGLAAISAAARERKQFDEPAAAAADANSKKLASLKQKLASFPKLQGLLNRSAREPKVGANQHNVPSNSQSFHEPDAHEAPSIQVDTPGSPQVVISVASEASGRAEREVGGSQATHTKASLSVESQISGDASDKRKKSVTISEFEEIIIDSNQQQYSNTNNNNNIIDPNSNEPNFNRLMRQAGEWCQNHVRFFAIGFALLSPFLVTYQKKITSVAINEMIVQPSKKQQVAARDISESFVSTIGLYLGDNNREGKKYTWDEKFQGYVKSAYTFGHIPFQAFGGRCAEIYGPFWVIASCAFLMGIVCVLTPIFGDMNRFSYIFFLALLGFLSSVATPALMTLFSNWLASDEKSLFMSFYLVLSRCGAAGAAFMAYFVKSYHLPTQFNYIFGGLFSMAFSLLFVLLLRDKPSQHWLVGANELEYLSERNVNVKESLEKRQRKQEYELSTLQNDARQDTQASSTSHGLQPTLGNINEANCVSTQSAKRAKKKAPWTHILSSATVWGFFVTKVCVKFCGEAMENEFPSYLKKIVKDDENEKSMGMNYLLFCSGCLISGFAARYLITKQLQYLTKTRIRKLFQCTASFGVALGILIISQSSGNKTLTKHAGEFVFIITTLGTAGEAQIPFDISAKYPGTIHGLASSMSSLVGVLQPNIFGWLLENRSYNPQVWSTIWLCISLMSAFGGLSFLFLCEAEIQPFDSIIVLDNEQKDGDERPVTLTLPPVVEIQINSAGYSGNRATIEGHSSAQNERGPI